MRSNRARSSAVRCLVGAAAFWVTRRSSGVICRRFDELDAVLESDIPERQLLAAVCSAKRIVDVENLEPARPDRDLHERIVPQPVEVDRILVPAGDRRGARPSPSRTSRAAHAPDRGGPPALFRYDDCGRLLSGFDLGLDFFGSKIGRYPILRVRSIELGLVGTDQPVYDGPADQGKYPPAKPGALGYEPLEAAVRGR
jgi:hypothetical protein